MVEVQCLEDCHYATYDGGSRCFTRDGIYTVVAGDLHDMAEVELIDDQGDPHTVSGLWATRFIPVRSEIDVLTDYAVSLASARRELVEVEENLLWEEEKPTCEVEPPVPRVRGARQYEAIVPGYHEVDWDFPPRPPRIESDDNE